MTHLRFAFEITCCIHTKNTILCVSVDTVFLQVLCFRTFRCWQVLYFRIFIPELPTKILKLNIDMEIICQIYEILQVCSYWRIIDWYKRGIGLHMESIDKAKEIRNGLLI